MSATLSSLEQQLAQLKAVSTLPAPYTPPVSPSSFTLEDIKNVVKELIVTEFGVAREAFAPLVQAAEEKIVTLDDALSSILTGDEQKWLSIPENAKRIPEFILTEVGKPLTQQFIKEFRSKYGS
jgi:hypothetical protein